MQQRKVRLRRITSLLLSLLFLQLASVSAQAQTYGVIKFGETGQAKQTLTGGYTAYAPGTTAYSHWTVIDQADDGNPNDWNVTETGQVTVPASAAGAREYTVYVNTCAPAQGGAPNMWTWTFKYSQSTSSR